MNKIKMSYNEINIPIKEEFIANQIELNHKYYPQFSDWFIQKYLFKINEKIAENLGKENIHTYFKIHIPTHILKNHRVIKKNKYSTNQYHLPKILYDKITNIWTEKRWNIIISDEIYYDKKSQTDIHKIASKKDRLSKNYVIIKVTIPTTIAGGGRGRSRM
jgi:hypothetical protein